MSTKHEKERQKLIQEKCQQMLNDMLRDEDNKYCVDCDAKGPRWASWNLGLFLCIRCAGIHRNLGVHISKVKSVNLDTWTPEQVVSMTNMGNSRARAVYEANLPDTFRRPQTDVALENFIRAKYEHKKYLAKEFVPPEPVRSVDWSKEIEDMIASSKNKVKLQQGGGSGGLFPKLKIPERVAPVVATQIKKEVVVEGEQEVKKNQEETLFDLSVEAVPSKNVQEQSAPLSDLLEGLSLNQQQQDQQKLTKESILSLYGGGGGSNFGGGGGGMFAQQQQQSTPFRNIPATTSANLINNNNNNNNLLSYSNFIGGPPPSAPGNNPFLIQGPGPQQAPPFPQQQQPPPQQPPTTADPLLNLFNFN